MIQILSKLSSNYRQFYKFLSLHTFLTSLFPVLLPSFLWMRGYRLTEVAIFIAISGLSFVCALKIWERLSKGRSFKEIILLSFILQILLVSGIFIENQTVFLLTVAICNGAVNCFFWISQRVLFFETIGKHNAGRQFGNMQITMALLLNLGIAFGAFMLEKVHFEGVYLVFVIIAGTALFLYAFSKKTPDLPTIITSSKPLTNKQIIGFKDNYRSIAVFGLDGLFLYLESYFWIISLYLIAHESFLKLGLLIISLALILAIIFYWIKNIIDATRKQLIYNVAVCLYGLSWLLRAWVDDQTSLLMLFVMLTSLSFFTALFRLSFNKRFFNIAKVSGQHDYLFIKSYHSQLFVAIAFFIIAVVSYWASSQNVEILSNIYYVVALLCPIYWLYKAPAEEV